MIYPALCLGAAGGVLGVSNCSPKATLALYKAFCGGDHEKARRIQRALLPLVSVAVTHGVAGLKLAMSLAGMRGGTVRAPLLPAAPGLVEEIRPLLAALDAAL